MHPRQITLRLNVLWSLTGNVVYAVCQLGILVVLAKLGTHEMIGQFALGLAIASPVMICAGLSSLRIVQATDARADHRFQDYLGLRVLTTIAGLAAVAGILYFTNYSPITAGVVLIVAVAKAIENLSDVFGGLLQHHERMDLVALSAMLRGTLSLLQPRPLHRGANAHLRKPFPNHPNPRTGCCCMLNLTSILETFTQRADPVPTSSRTALQLRAMRACIAGFQPQSVCSMSQWLPLHS